MLEDEPDPALLNGNEGGVFLTEEDAAGIGNLQPRDGAQQRGLAGARGAEQCHQFAGTDRHADIAQSGRLREVLGQMFDANVHSDS